MRLLFEVDRFPDKRVFDLDGGWVGEAMPSLGLLAVEGNPADGELWSPGEVLGAGARVRELVDGTFGVRRDRGVSRLDVTTSRRFIPQRGRAFLTGMAALELPRMQVTRRGRPVQSVWWTGAKSAAIKGRAYCESFKVPEREPFSQVRLEDQGRFPNGRRPPLEVAADPDEQRRQFERRWQPMRKAVNGVTAASFPVIAQALADEARYGYRSVREVERLAGALVVLTGGAGEAYKRSTLYNRRAELREAGYVVVDDLTEAVEVNLGDELERALEEFGG